MSKDTGRAQRALDEATKAERKGDTEGKTAKIRQAAIIIKNQNK